MHTAHAIRGGSYLASKNRPYSRRLRLKTAKILHLKALARGGANHSSTASSFRLYPRAVKILVSARLHWPGKLGGMPLLQALLGRFCWFWGTFLSSGPTYHDLGFAGLIVRAGTMVRLKLDPPVQLRYLACPGSTEHPGQALWRAPGVGSAAQLQFHHRKASVVFACFGDLEQLDEGPQQEHRSLSLTPMFFRS